MIGVRRYTTYTRAAEHRRRHGAHPVAGFTNNVRARLLSLLCMACAGDDGTGADASGGGNDTSAAPTTEPSTAWSSDPCGSTMDPFEQPVLAADIDDLVPAMRCAG